ncbi:MAG: NADH-quinone oxidoreductase subunit N, partial [Planctomycetota bacterium]|nr:NADH-quinone oxidoreductase subunit N [Planctomycetota bacterium]
MIEKLGLLHPEIALFVTTCIVMILGLSKARGLRRSCAFVTAAGLIVAAVLGVMSPRGAAPGLTDSILPNILPYAKTLIALVGLLILPLLSGVVDRSFEYRLTKGAKFDPGRATRGEFYAFFLFSLTGVMLCVTADDLIWLFLALELTSLPTYLMVAMSSSRLRSQEAGVKYFFLGAFGAAIFLYGFALIYGATGATKLPEIQIALARTGYGPLAILGFVLAFVGVSFKIAAVPMHFYTPDVYQGAAAPVSAYLAFAPKAAGFFVITALAATLGWTHGPLSAGLPEAARVTLWVMAAMTMTVGNVLAVLQSNVKRMLAYSSIAHSGYMLVGIVAGPGMDPRDLANNGVAAVLFYLLVYGVMNLGAFAVIACFE